MAPAIAVLDVLQHGLEARAARGKSPPDGQAKWPSDLPRHSVVNLEVPFLPRCASRPVGQVFTPENHLPCGLPGLPQLATDLKERVQYARRARPTSGCRPRSDDTYQ